jgi:hypothetical protein
MKKKIFALSCSALLLFSLSCKKSPTDSSSETIVGSGTLVTEVRSLAQFHSVDLNTVGNLNVTQGAGQEVSVTINDNILQYIQTTVSNGKLIIDVEPGHQFSNFNLTVDITMTDLEALSNMGAGSISGINTFKVDSVSLALTGAGEINFQIEADQLNSSLSGAGNIVLSGTVSTHQIGLSGAGNILAFELITETSTINLSGAGRAEVYVNQLLDVTISGAGSVYYKGQPTIIQNITGSGSLIDAN